MLQSAPECMGVLWSAQGAPECSGVCGKVWSALEYVGVLWRSMESQRGVGRLGRALRGYSPDSKDLRWGHVMKECRTVVACAWCGGPHTKEQHRAACGQCNSRKLPPEKRTPAGMECPHPPLCVNCGEAHTADGSFTKVYYQGEDGTHYTKKIQCPFWKVKFRNGAWKILYEQVYARQVLQRESSGSNTPLRFPPRSAHPV